MIRKVQLGFALGFALLLAVAVTSYQSVVSFREGTRSVERAQVVLEHFGSLLSSVTDIETGYRGYDLSGDESFLQPYYSGISNARREQSSLASLVRDTIQKQRLQVLDDLINQKIQHGEVLIRLRRTRGNTEIDEALLGRGKQLMDEIRTAVAEAQKREHQLLAERDAEAERRLRRVKTTLILAAGLGLLIALASLWIISRDMLARQKVEEELQRQQMLFEGLFEAAPDAVVATNAQGRIVRVNSETERLFGYSREELIGQPVETLMPARFTEHARHRQRYERDPGRRPMGAGLDLYGKRKDGTEFTVDIMLSPLRAKDGDLVLAVVRDITARKQTEQALATKTADLIRSNADLEQFAYIASHDLQEPLRMVSSYTQLLARRYKGRLDPTADEFIAFAVGGARRMHQLIQDLLLYSRVGTKGTEMRISSSSAALNVALGNLKVSVANSAADITHDNMPEVWADESQLVQLFQNLVGNSIKYRSPEPPRIHIRASRNGRPEWLFSIKDNGMGIDPQYFDQIFGMFQRLQTREHSSGTGIGLAICKKIVERHGGRIWLESAPGKGSTFYFTLPEGPPR